MNLPQSLASEGRKRPTKRALDAGDSAVFSSSFLASSFLCSQAESTPTPAPVTQAVGWLTQTPWYIDMNIEFKKDWLPIWCENCDQQGYIFIDDIKNSYYVICKNCGWEASQVSCPTCEMGGSFVRSINKRPETWECSECNSIYKLSSDFYKKPIWLILEKNLPSEAINRINKYRDVRNETNQFKIVLDFIVLALFLLGLIAPLAFLFLKVTLLPDKYILVGLLAFVILSIFWFYFWAQFYKKIIAIYNKWRSQELH